MNTQRLDSSHFQQTHRSKCLLLALFPDSDSQLHLFIRVCDALDFHTEIATDLREIEKKITHVSYDIVLLDTRKQIHSTIFDSLKILAQHSSRSYFIAFCSSGIRLNPKSKLKLLLSLLQNGVDRILRQSNDPIDYAVQLLSARDVDLPRKQRSQMCVAISNVLNYWPQALQIVNENFEFLYQNSSSVADERIRFEWIQQMKHEFVETRRPWKWKLNETNGLSSILFIPLHLNTKTTTVNPYSFESIEHDRSDSSLIQRRSMHSSLSTRNNRLSHQRRLNKYYIDALRHARNEKHRQSIIEKIASEFNLKKKIMTIDQLIRTLQENQVDVSLLNDHLILLSEEIRNELSRWKTWDFNLIRLEPILGSRTLFYVTKEIFSYFNVSQSLHCSEEILMNWIWMISRNYYDLPYHSGLHGTDVLQAASFFLFNRPCRSIFTELERTVILISCLCHDIQHPGRTNTHLINARDPLALLYNDQTVLENHHASVTFRLTCASNDVNIFAGLSSEDFRFVRTMIIDSILVTDISKHFEMVQRFSLRKKQIDHQLIKIIEDKLVSRRIKTSKIHINSEQINHFKQNIRRMMMKMADLSNATRPQSIAYSWAVRLAEELFRQTEYEKENHLILTNDMFTRETCNLARTQINFYDLFMREMLVEWVDFTQLKILKENFEDNYTFWNIDETKHQTDRSHVNR